MRPAFSPVRESGKVSGLKELRGDNPPAPPVSASRLRREAAQRKTKRHAPGVFPCPGVRKSIQGQNHDAAGRKTGMATFGPHPAQAWKAAGAGQYVPSRCYDVGPGSVPPSLFLLPPPLLFFSQRPKAPGDVRSPADGRRQAEFTSAVRRGGRRARPAVRKVCPDSTFLRITMTSAFDIYVSLY